jgi:prophage regulatory protein
MSVEANERTILPVNFIKGGSAMNSLNKLPQVLAKTGLSKSHLYALAQKGEFPKPIKLSERSSAWVESEVNDWIDARIAARDLEELQ